jgi:hypothetical protein
MPVTIEKRNEVQETRDQRRRWLEALRLLQSDQELRDMVARALVREPHVLMETIIHVREELEVLEGAVRYMNDELFAPYCRTRKKKKKKREGQQ